jgi:magnesium chelatase family protein
MFLKYQKARLDHNPYIYTRILKVARTIADLEDQENIQPAHLSEAMQCRTLDRNLIA